MKVSEVLQNKGAEVVTVSPGATVQDLVAALAEHNIGAAVVSTDGRQVSGIVSERDVARALVAGAEALNRPVSDIMTAAVRTALPDQSLDELARQMTDHRIRHVPVVVDGRLEGIVSIGDVVKSRIEELEFERDQLTSYVSNSQ